MAPRIIHFDLATGEECSPGFGLSVPTLGGLIANAEPSARLAVGKEAVARYDAEMQGEIQRSVATRCRRTDAAGPDLGALALSLTARRREIIEEPFPPVNATKFFRTYSEVPPGAEEYAVPYLQRTGEVAEYRAGVRIPRVGVSGYEDKAPIVHLVTSTSMDYFAAQAAAFSAQNIGMAVVTEANLMRAARIIMAQRANRIWWNGDASFGIWGVLTHPLLSKVNPTVAFDGSASPADVAESMISLANYAKSTSNQVFAPNRILASPRVRSYLFRTRLGSVNDTTIGKFVEDATGMKIEEAWELKEAGGTLVDGVLFYNDSMENTAIVQSQGFMVHPPYTIGLETVTVMHMSIGGGLMMLPGSNLLALVTAPNY